MTEWRLRFTPRQIRTLASGYAASGDDDAIKAGVRARNAGKYSRNDFLTVCAWKTVRSRTQCRRNSPEEVSAITKFALSTNAERVRIEVLTCLYGVGWPTASALLHLSHPDPYPILDVRALWSLGFEKVPSYSFELWWRYVQTCRRISEQQGVEMRTLDRALWQYSKDHQQPA